MISINKSSRDQALDLMRGIAIIMMIMFHLIYDLNEFGYTNIPLSNFWLTSYWRYLIVFLFLNAVGISLVIAYGKSFNLNKFIKRLALLGLAALSVSVGTYILFQDAWVYFGILHLIWTGTLIAIFFIQLPKISLFIAAIPVFLIMVSFVGACVGSTGGGIKVVRILVMFRLGMKEIKKFIRPSAQVSVKLNQTSLTDKTIISVLGFFSLYAISFVIILMLLMFIGLDQVSAYSATAATMNNLGPGLGQVAENYGSLSDSAKWVLSFSMLIGRLEVLTIIALFHKAFWRN